MHYSLRGSGHTSPCKRSLPRMLAAPSWACFPVLSSRVSTKSNKCLPHFDVACLPTANRASDYIIVSRNSPLISARLPPALRPISHRGRSFIGGGASHPRDAPGSRRVPRPQFTLGSPHAANKIDGLARRSPGARKTIKSEWCAISSFRVAESMASRATFASGSHCSSRKQGQHPR